MLIIIIVWAEELACGSFVWVGSRNIGRLILSRPWQYGGRRVGKDRRHTDSAHRITIMTWLTARSAKPEDFTATDLSFTSAAKTGGCVWQCRCRRRGTHLRTHPIGSRARRPRLDRGTGYAALSSSLGPALLHAIPRVTTASASSVSEGWHAGASSRTGGSSLSICSGKGRSPSLGWLRVRARRLQALGPFDRVPRAHKSANVTAATTMSSQHVRRRDIHLLAAIL